MNQRLICSLVLSLGIFSLSAKAAVYVGLAGQAQDMSQDDLVSDLTADFTGPIDQMRPHVKAYYSFQTDGNRQFNLGLIAEAMDAQGEKDLVPYVKKLEQSGFHGFPVQFHVVLKIQEQVSMLAGTYDASAGENGYNVNSETDQQFGLATLNDWETFSDNLGFALQSQQSSDFLNYIAWFLGGPEQFATYAENVLAKDNFVYAELNPTLVLVGGQTVGPDAATTPFFNMPVVRDCWSTSFENGMCYP